ncbi:hypothetical protein ACFXJ8_25175 [Nonomuraea sp. NPDC059194]|uniref:hypothetical protein n=1 Tax=Nonomuraea sp. NPDC059194 TaxID=3346764 RepID=UPI0036832BA2
MSDESGAQHQLGGLVFDYSALESIYLGKSMRGVQLIISAVQANETLHVPAVALQQLTATMPLRAAELLELSLTMVAPLSIDHARRAGEVMLAMATRAGTVTRDAPVEYTVSAGHAVVLAEERGLAVITAQPLLYAGQPVEIEPLPS